MTVAPVSHRFWRQWSAAWIGLLALAWPPITSAELTLVGSSVYADLGDNTDVAPTNAGHTANSGLIVGKSQALVIDTGISLNAGEALLEDLRHITDRPVLAAVLTHAVPNFIFGAHVFELTGIPIVAHRGTARLMQQRCEYCLMNLRKVLGEDLMAGTELVKPGRLIDRSETLDLGSRKVELIALGSASTPGDIAVFDRRTGCLFAGGLITANRIPTLRDGKIDDWIKGLHQVRKLPVVRVVPGFGPVGGPEQIDRMLDYLSALKRIVTEHYRRGASLIEAMDSSALPAFEGWQGYETRHSQNVSYVYRQLEVSDFR